MKKRTGLLKRQGNKARAIAHTYIQTEIQKNNFSQEVAIFFSNHQTHGQTAKNIGRFFCFTHFQSLRKLMNSPCVFALSTTHPKTNKKHKKDFKSGLPRFKNILFHHFTPQLSIYKIILPPSLTISPTDPPMHQPNLSMPSLKDSAVYFVALTTRSSFSTEFQRFMGKTVCSTGIAGDPKRGLSAGLAGTAGLL